MIDERLKLAIWRVVAFVVLPLYLVVDFGFYLHERWQWRRAARDDS